MQHGPSKQLGCVLFFQLLDSGVQRVFAHLSPAALHILADCNLSLLPNIPSPGLQWRVTDLYLLLLLLNLCHIEEILKTVR